MTAMCSETGIVLRCTGENVCAVRCHLGYRLLFHRRRQQRRLLRFQRLHLVAAPWLRSTRAALYLPCISATSNGVLPCSAAAMLRLQ